MDGCAVEQDHLQHARDINLAFFQVRVYFFVYFFPSNINYLQTKATNNSWLKSAIIFIYEIVNNLTCQRL